MIRLEELKAYQRTRMAGTDTPADDALWPSVPAVSERLMMVPDTEVDAVVEAA